MEIKQYLVAVVLFVLDQVVKHATFGMERDFGLLSLTTVKNTGSLFGLFPDSAVILTGIGIVAVILLIVFQNEFSEYPTVFSLLLAGVASNTVDRILYGYVIDFLDVWIWPVFNFADVYITIGVAVILWVEVVDY